MYTPSHRDPLTQRFARTVRETVRDPHDYSEGAAEPQLVDVVRSFPDAARRRWNGHNTQRVHCVDTSRLPAAPAPAEACTDLGADDRPFEPDDYPRQVGQVDSPFGDTPGSARATRHFLIACALVAAAVAWVLL